jgi:beta-glucosidase
MPPSKEGVEIVFVFIRISRHISRVKIFSILMGGLLAVAAAKADSSSIYHDGWIDLNKNGKMDVYEDSTQPINKRVNDLLKAHDAR